MKLFTNWKTTSIGILMIAGAIINLVFAEHRGQAEWTASVTGIVGGLGFLFAKDFNVTGGNKDQGSGDPKL